MVHPEELVRLGVESEYTKRLLAVLPLFVSDLPCYTHASLAHYNTAQEHELKSLRSSLHFEVRFLHVTLSRAEAALADDTFVGCADTLKSLLDLLESLLRIDTVTYLENLLVVDVPGSVSQFAETCFC